MPFKLEKQTAVKKQNLKCYLFPLVVGGPVRSSLDKDNKARKGRSTSSHDPSMTIFLNYRITEILTPGQSISFS